MLVKQKAKYIQSLGQKKFRDEEKLFIAEGPKIVNEFIATNPSGIVEIFAISEWIEENEQRLKELSFTAVTVADLERISQLSSPNKVLAVAKQSAPVMLPDPATELVLVLDAIRDPGNLGTIIRIADWFNVTHIVCSYDTAEQYNPKVVQATMGSLLRVGVSYTNLDSWVSSHADVPCYAAALRGMPVQEIGKVTNGLLMIGNESGGLSESLQSLATVHISIPGSGAAESLNAAVATGIILSHII